MSRPDSYTRGLAGLGQALGVIMIVIYLGRLIILDPTNIVVRSCGWVGPGRECETGSGGLRATGFDREFDSRSVALRRVPMAAYFHRHNPRPVGRPRCLL